MFEVQRITSFDAPELVPYRTMRQQLDHQQQGIFVAEGEKVVRRLLETDFQVVSLLFPEKWLPHFEPMMRPRSESIRVYLAEKPVLENLTGFSMYQGVLAVAKIPPPWPLEKVLKHNPRPYFFAAVDMLSNAENLGGLVRSAVAFGVQALLVGETSSSPYLRRAVRASMGTIFRLPVVNCSSLAGALRELGEHGISTVAAHPHTEQKLIYNADLSGDCCIVFGSEGHGIQPAVLEACEHIVAIPMPAHIDSLNVGSAAAAFLFEASRQRHLGAQRQA